MFDWLYEIEKPIIRLNDESGELRIKKINSEISLNQMSEVCQLFASFSVIIGSDALTELPTTNDDALNTIMNEIVPHYLDVKEIYIGGILRKINVRRLKRNSSKMIEELLSDGIYPVIPDLYRSNSPNLATEPRKLKYFSVRQELISQPHIMETEKIKNFFNNSFFAETGSVFITPTGWSLEENLKESITIRTFCTFANKIILVIDTKDRSVVGLDIHG
ncbi:MAG: hypothetical protein JWM44_401 [Bacilli bacterium]|nr:hypothetical protein [Bacilli bacterium]